MACSQRVQVYFTPFPIYSYFPFWILSHITLSLSFHHSPDITRAESLSSGDYSLCTWVFCFTRILLQFPVLPSLAYHYVKVLSTLQVVFLRDSARRWDKYKNDPDHISTSCSDGDIEHVVERYACAWTAGCSLGSGNERLSQ